MYKRFFFILFFSCIMISSCFESPHFYDLGDGYQFGYYNNSKSTSNVFYNDAGIIKGICYYIEWNDNFIMVKSYASNSLDTKPLEIETFLIDKKLYSANPMQSESEAVIGPLSDDSLKSIMSKKNILFRSQREIHF